MGKGIILRAITSGLAVTLPIGLASAAVPQKASFAAQGAVDRSNITFKSAITIEAIQRSNDIVVRRLIGQVGTLKKQMSAGKGDAARLRLDLARTQDEMIRRLAETDAKYAAERAAFLQGIGSLFDGGDPSILALLHRYADGDNSALAQLQATIGQSNTSPPQRLLNQKALATLVVDAVRRDERDIREKISAYEAILKDNPDDYGALLQIRGLYLASSQVERAQDVSERIAAIEKGPEFDNAPQMRALTLGQNARASLQSGRVDEALRYAERAVAVTRAMVSESYDDWRSRHPTATEPRRVIESYNREQLAIALGILTKVQRAKRNYDSAILAGEEAVALRRLNAEDELRRVGEMKSAYADYASDDAIGVGDLMMAKGDPQGALSAYRTALALQKLGPFPQSRVNVEPYWIYIPMAAASIAAGHLAEADQQLNEAFRGMQKAEPNAWLVASEGKYWMQRGDLFLANGKPQEAREAWLSAESALGQATALDRDNQNWQDTLAMVELRLGKTK